jgi:predicted DCC family thiol-disulfide oxidoreductase YuxK
VAELEKRARELVARIQDRAERTKVEKEAQRQTAEMKREAQRALRSAAPGDASAEPRDVKIVRDGKVVGKNEVVAEEPEYLPGPEREIRVGDKVKLRSFGSIGIVDQVKDGEAEVRVKALRFREKLDNLELVEAAPQPKVEKGKLEKLRQAANTEYQYSTVEARSELNVIGCGFVGEFESGQNYPRARNWSVAAGDRRLVERSSACGTCIDSSSGSRWRRSNSGRVEAVGTDLQISASQR